MLLKQIRLVIDTNLWISFLLNNNFSILGELIRSQKVKLLFDSTLNSEIISVASRPKFKKYISNEQIFTLIDTLDFYGETITVTSVIEECRDVKDNFLLSLAVDGEADFLITGDKDLLVLKQIEKTRILKISEFIELINTKLK